MKKISTDCQPSSGETAKQSTRDNRRREKTNEKGAKDKQEPTQGMAA